MTSYMKIPAACFNATTAINELVELGLVKSESEGFYTMKIGNMFTLKASVGQSHCMFKLYLNTSMIGEWYMNRDGGIQTAMQQVTKRVGMYEKA